MQLLRKLLSLIFIISLNTTLFCMLTEQELEVLLIDCSEKCELLTANDCEGKADEWIELIEKMGMMKVYLAHLGYAPEKANTITSGIQAMENAYKIYLSRQQKKLLLTVMAEIKNYIIERGS